jgi:acyl-CoA synthetase (AMP-forming)/AMP-acid ligase II
MSGTDEPATLVALKARLAPYKVPKRIFHTGEIPRNRMGKVLKAELRSNFRDLFTPLQI